VLAASLSAQHTRPTARRPPPRRRPGVLGGVQVILALGHLRPITRLHWRSCAPTNVRTSPDSRVVGRKSFPVLAASLSAQHTRPTARRRPSRRRLSIGRGAAPCHEARNRSCFHQRAAPEARNRSCFHPRAAPRARNRFCFYPGEAPRAQNDSSPDQD
jgi:hypothetical protein